MSFNEYAENEVQNSDAQFGREFARKRKLENDEQQQQTSYPNKRLYFRDSSPTFKKEASYDSDEWNQFNTQVQEHPRKSSANDTLKNRLLHIDNSLEQSNSQSNSTVNNRLRIVAPSHGNSYKEQSHWVQSDQHAELPNKSHERFRYDTVDNSRGYWGHLNQKSRVPTTSKYSANDRLKQVRASLNNVPNTSKSESNLLEETQANRFNSSTHLNINSYQSAASKNENDFADKLQTDVAQRHNFEKSLQWRKNSIPSDSSLTENSRYVNSYTSSTSSDKSQKKNSPSTSNLQERLHKIRNNPNSKSYNPTNKEQLANTGETVVRGWLKVVDAEPKDPYSLYNPFANAATINCNRSGSFTQNRQSVRDCNNYENENVTRNNNNSRPSQNDDNGSFTNATSSSSTQEDEVMDWNYIQERAILSDLEDLRKNFTQTSTPQSAFQEVIAKESSEIDNNKTLFKTTYIVVDTNIFLSHLKVVQDIMKIKINGNTDVTYVTILVPWIVIQELDYIKDRRSHTKSNLNVQAQRAIYFINDCLVKKLHLQGQSVRDAAQQDFVTSNFDDGILHCCMQIRERNNRAILLSNDVNLRNKLLTENFEAYSHRDILEKLDPFYISVPNRISSEVNTKETEKFAEMKIQLATFLSSIILDVARDVYGSVWNKMALLNQNQPWTLQMCMQIFEKYWQSVFRMDLHERFLSNAKSLNRFLNEKVIDTKRLLDLALAVCIDLRTGYQLYSDTVTEEMKTLQKIHDR